MRNIYLRLREGSANLLSQGSEDNHFDRGPGGLPQLLPAARAGGKEACRTGNRQCHGWRVPIKLYL